jgi:transcriptional regulator with XRE-family HTH domain
VNTDQSEDAPPFITAARLSTRLAAAIQSRGTCVNTPSRLPERFGQSRAANCAWPSTLWREPQSRGCAFGRLTNAPGFLEGEIVFQRAITTTFRFVSGPARSRCLCQNGNDAYAAAAMANDEADGLRQEIGKRMRQARTDVLGEASLGVMSDRLGVSRSEISRWETGVRSPSAVDFVRFARVLSVPPEKVLSGIAPARQHQMTLVGLDVPAAKVVRRLVHLLRERKAS